MMMARGDELDLDRGDPEYDTPAQRRRARRQRASESSPGVDGSQGFTEKQVREQLGKAFDWGVRSREAKGDAELAEAIQEEGAQMTEGFVTLTNNVTALRLPLIVVLNVLITFGAFGRVGGILWGRFKNWRAERVQDVDVSMENGVPIHEVQ